MITEELGRGVTVCQGKNGYEKGSLANDPRDIIFTEEKLL
jgi:hypothetical protein